MLTKLSLALTASLMLSANAVRQPPTAPPLKLMARKGNALTVTLEQGA